MSNEREPKEPVGVQLPAKPDQIQQVADEVVSDEHDPNDPGCVQPPSDEPDLIQQVADELEAAGVLRKTGKQRDGCDVYVLVPGKTHADYVAWLERQSKN